MKKVKFIVFLLGAMLVVAALVSACGQASTPTPEAPSSQAPTTEALPTDAPTGESPTATELIGLDGETLMVERCSTCHTTSRITLKTEDLEEWTTIVDDMIGRGAVLNSEERQALIDYLANTYK